MTSLTNITLDATALYNAQTAHHLKLQGNVVCLDLRNAQNTVQGIVVTDPIAPNQQDICDAYTVKIWHIKTNAEIPVGSTLQCFAKTGPSYFTETDWTDWTPIDLEQTVESPAHPYLKLKYLFTSTKPNTSPAIKSVTIQAEVKNQSFKHPLQITQSQNENLITSTFSFGYESPDCPPIQNFVETHHLHDLIRDKKTDLECFFALNHFVAQLPNTRHNMWSASYPWTLDQLLVQENGQTAIKGHCMSYASVLISALTGLGYYARHWAVEGFRFMNHEIVEVWSNELKKWIYLDPSLDQHYTHPKTGAPLSLLEMHDIYVNTFFQDGETLLMPMDQQHERMKKIGGQNATILCQDLGYHYGTFTPDYDWGWFHGYLATGFLRLTTRNNYHSQPEPAFHFFGEGNEEDYGFPSWIDAKTPPRTDRVKIFSGRKRDFYWTLNQASFRATRTTENTLQIELGNTQPFFSHYRITLNNTSFDHLERTYELTLRKGENTFSVSPIDKWNKEGIQSIFRLIY